MARGKRFRSSSRDGTGFIALPDVVVDSAAYQALPHPARSLLVEIARQYRGDNNGGLVASSIYLEPRGWKSRDVITRARNALIDAGLLFETRKGGFPNKEAWYAVTWYSLDRLDGFDVGVAAGFRRGAYLDLPTVKNASLVPSDGPSSIPIRPSDGTRKLSLGPSHGPIRQVLAVS